METEAAGAASATKATGFAGADVVKATGMAEAEANKARGLAEATVIEAQGKATASAMQAKAESFKQYNEAAVIEMIVRVLPEVAGKISEPLSKTEKMVIINSGNGPGRRREQADRRRDHHHQPVAARAGKSDRREVREIAGTGPRAEKSDGQG